MALHISPSEHVVAAQEQLQVQQYFVRFVRIVRISWPARKLSTCLVCAWLCVHVTNAYSEPMPTRLLSATMQRFGKVF